MLKFAMGRVVLALYRRKDNAGQAEDGIMAGTFLLLFVMVLGMFRLEGCGLNQRGGTISPYTFWAGSSD